MKQLLRAFAILALTLCGTAQSQAQSCTDTSDWCSIFIRCFKASPSGIWNGGACVEVWQGSTLRGTAAMTTVGGDTVEIAVCRHQPIDFRWRTDSIAMMFNPYTNIGYRFEIMNYADEQIRFQMGLTVDDTLFYTWSDDPCFACWTPSEIEVHNITATEATVTWTDVPAAETWTCLLTNLSTGGVSTITAWSNQLQLSWLTPVTDYNLSVVGQCGSDVSEAATVTFRTSAPSVDVLPYATGFEAGEDRNWSFANGANAWVIDSGTASTGDWSLFISADSGATNNYVDQPCVSYAWRSIVLANQGDYELQFDWRVLGEHIGYNDYDYMRVFLVPDSYELVADTYPERSSWPSWASHTYFNSYTPTGWIAFTPATMSNQRLWQHFSTTFTIDTSQVGTWKLCFIWANDNSTTHNNNFGAPAGGIDNLSFKHICSYPPSNVVLDSIVDDEVFIHWTGVGAIDEYAVFVSDSLAELTSETHSRIGPLRMGTVYRISVRSSCMGGELSDPVTLDVTMPCLSPAPVPYWEDFEYMVEGYPVNPCWVEQGTISQQSDDEAGRYIFFNQTNSRVVLPQFVLPPDSLEVTLRAKKQFGTAKIVVGVTSDSSAATFDTVAVVAVPTDNRWRDYTVPLTAYTGSGSRIVIATSWYTGLSIDEVRVDRAASCPRPGNIAVDSIDSTSARVTWHSDNNAMYYQVVWKNLTTGARDSSLASDTTAWLTALSGNTRYVVYVSGICDDGFRQWPIRTLFATECSPLAVPFAENFESQDGFPECWTALPRDVGYQLPKINTDETGNRHIFYGTGGTVLLPEADHPLAELQLELDYSCGLNVIDYLLVGAMEDTTFVAVDTLTTVGHHQVFFTGYTGPSRIIALRARGNWYYYNQVDNVEVLFHSTCTPAQGLRVVEVRDDELMLDWTDVTDQATAWEVTLTSDTSTYSMVVLSHPCTIGGLVEGTAYTARVRTICSADSAVWSQPLEVSTTCALLGIDYGVTLFDDFEENTPCWQILTPIGNRQAMPERRVLHTHYSGSVSLNVPSRDEYLFSPQFTSADSLIATFHFTAGQRNSPAVLHIGCASSLNLESIVWIDTLSGEVMNNVWNPAGLHLPSWAKYVVLHKGNDLDVLIDDFRVLIDDGSLAECDTLEILSAEQVGDRIVVTWALGSGTYYYDIAHYEWDGSEMGYGTTDTTAWFYASGSYRAGDTVTFGVRQLCPNGQLSDWSTRAIEVTDPDCSSPSLFALYSAGIDRAEFWWDTTGGDTTCQMMLIGDGGNTVLPVGTMPYTIVGLHANTYYKALYRKVCGAGHPGPWSADTIIFQTDYCHPVSGLTITDASSSSVQLQWNDAATGMGQWAVEFRPTGGDVTWTQVTATINPFYVSSLVAGVEYEFRVASYCTDELLSEYCNAVTHTITPSSGIGNADAQAGITVYPNPTDGLTTITLPEDEPTVRVTVLDMTGRRVLELQSSNGTAILDASQFPSGAYFIRLAGERCNMTKKLIVR